MYILIVPIFYFLTHFVTNFSLGSARKLKICKTNAVSSQEKKRVTKQQQAPLLDFPAGCSLWRKKKEKRIDPSFNTRTREFLTPRRHQIRERRLFLRYTN